MNPVIDRLRLPPFNLDESAISWVAATCERLPLRRKLAQLFNVMLDPTRPDHVADLARLQPGAITQFTIGGLELATAAARQVAAACDTPLLVSGDVEGGSICLDGTSPMPSQLGMAALPDAEHYGRALQVMMSEARAVGLHWTFSPVVDINANFRSTIVGTRSFGSDPARVRGLGQLHVSRVQSLGMAATAKHWPGEGFDARDQHVITTVNPLSVPAWRESFGQVYGDMIAAGVKTIMVGHIAFPAYAAQLGATGLERYRPASVSRHLNLELLRGELGFNGLIVSDATEMGGLTSWSPRRVHLPEIIENGCDMVLFTDDLARDLDWLEAALADGRLSADRVEQALVRVLGLKASLGLHQPSGHAPLPQREALRTEANLRLADETAGACVTLVKDVHAILPLSRQRHRRVTLITHQADRDLSPFPLPDLAIGELLTEQGFEVTAYSTERPPTPDDTDLLLYVVAQESMMTSGAIHFDWRRIQGPIWHAMRRHWHDLPCVLVSLGHPYYLHEAARMPCLINAYTPVTSVQREVVRRLVGAAPFTGVSPVDAFCGLEDAKY